MKAIANWVQTLEKDTNACKLWHGTMFLYHLNHFAFDEIAKYYSYPLLHRNLHPKHLKYWKSLQFNKPWGGNWPWYNCIVCLLIAIDEDCDRCENSHGSTIQQRWQLLICLYGVVHNDWLPVCPIPWLETKNHAIPIHIVKLLLKCIIYCFKYINNS